MIDLSEVSISLGRKLIVDGVTINVGSGEFVGLIGPNGSGKSTLLKTIYRFLSPDSGAIMIDGTDVRSCTLKESALKTAMVAQHSYMNFDFKVKDVVMMGRSPHKKPMEFVSGKDYRIVEDALERVGMTEYADQSFSTLSGGEQQRVVLARALAQQTPCLVLDEPTNHLDVKYQLQLMDAVSESGLTVICALHDLNVAAKYCHRIYMMKDGRIRYSGTPEEVLTEKNIEEVYGVKVAVQRSERTGNLLVEYIST